MYNVVKFVSSTNLRLGSHLENSADGGTKTLGDAGS